MRPYLLKRGRAMLREFPDAHLRELNALSETSGVDADQLLLGNTLFDLKKIVACSALLTMPERSQSDGPALARNLDYASLGYAEQYTLVTVYQPTDGRHAFVSVGFPGLVGCLSGMNDQGLALAVLEVFQVHPGDHKFQRQGTAYGLCYRRLLEECTTIPQALAALEHMKRTSATSLAIADRDGVAIFEVTPEHVRVRRPHDGICLCTNHFLTRDLKPLVQFNFYRTLDRYRALQRLTSCLDRFGPEELRAGLIAAANPRETLQSMIFEPASLRLHLAIGPVPACKSEMQVLDLGPLLQVP
jgi:predicted choloylglycine hydrolase